MTPCLCWAGTVTEIVTETATETGEMIVLGGREVGIGIGMIEGRTRIHDLGLDLCARRRDITCYARRFTAQSAVHQCAPRR